MKRVLLILLLIPLLCSCQLILDVLLNSYNFENKSSHTVSIILQTEDPKYTQKYYNISPGSSTSIIMDSSCDYIYSPTKYVREVSSDRKRTYYDK